MESLDCVIVGAGWYGLAAAKQYSVCQPGHTLAILDSQASVGGTWAKERIYTSLRTNNYYNMFQYPDFPMALGQHGAENNQHLPGIAVHEYLKSYADHFNLTPRIRFGVNVVSAEHQDSGDGGWILTLEEEGQEPSRRQVFAKRLIVASGLTSEPKRASFRGQEDFGGGVFHGRDFADKEDTLDKAHAVTVYGASKFAWDAVHAYAAAGANVDWVIRSSGPGSCWMTHMLVTPFRIPMERVPNVRAVTWLSPCIWGAEDGHPWIRRFLHGTWLGRLVVKSFWSLLAYDVLSRGGYDKHPETKKLKPRLDMMYIAASFSALNYDDDIFEFVRSGQVKVHIGDIDHLSRNTVHLDDGTSFETQFIFAHTGWHHAPSIKFLPEGIDAQLGLPHEVGSLKLDGGAEPEDVLLAKADQQIVSQFPSLKDRPACFAAAPASSSQASPSELTPFMLYRGMAPPSASMLRYRDIAFCGMMSNLVGPMNAHLQSLWVVAYMTRKLVRDKAADTTDASAMRALQWENILHNRFGKWRYPADWGTKKPPSVMLDSVPYWDMLLKDMGLDWNRGRGGLLARLFVPYMPRDYAGIVPEWRAKFQSIKGEVD